MRKKLAANDFTQYVQILGRGKKGARSLTTEEAEHAMSLLQSNRVLSGC
jgi:hypothetical protein